MKTLTRDFYTRDPVEVAKDLLNKKIVRRLGHDVLSGKIVETEAYVENDIASKTLRRRKVFGHLADVECGRAFIYMVHGNWLLNAIAHPRRSVGGVLIRAVEPLEGVEVMRKNRNAVNLANLTNLTNGPGKLTKALAIAGDLNGVDLTDRRSYLMITDEKKQVFEIASSHRIGVARDLPQPLRFFIKGNKFVSK